MHSISTSITSLSFDVSPVATEASFVYEIRKPSFFPLAQELTLKLSGYVTERMINIALNTFPKTAKLILSSSILRSLDLSGRTQLNTLYLDNSPLLKQVNLANCKLTEFDFGSTVNTIEVLDESGIDEECLHLTTFTALRSFTAKNAKTKSLVFGSYVNVNSFTLDLSGTPISEFVINERISGFEIGKDYKINAKSRKTVEQQILKALKLASLAAASVDTQPVTKRAACELQ